MKTLILCGMLISIGIAQQHRVILHINEQGIQDVIPIRPNETPKDVIGRFEDLKYEERKSGSFDTLRYFTNESELFTNFGIMGKEVALQWYSSWSSGEVTEFWWRNYKLNGAQKKARVRAWYFDSRLAEFPASRYDATGGLGYYAAKSGSLFTATPFKEDAQDAVFRTTNAAESVYVTFDPLTQEAPWKPGGIEVDLSSDQWQSVKMAETGNKFPINIGQLFGFTLQNISLQTDSAIRMELSSIQVDPPSPGSHFSTSHSLKFYQQPNATITKPGWFVRQYNFGMYIVYSMVYDEPYYTIGSLVFEPTVIANSPRTVTARIKNLQNGQFVSASVVKNLSLRYKIDNAIGFETVPTTVTDDAFTGVLPGIHHGQNLYFYLSGSAVSGARIVSNVVKLDQVTGVNDNIVIPLSSTLYQNYPNPFNPSTKIEYEISRSSHVKLTVIDVLGKEIAQLVNEQKEAGRYSQSWDASSFTAGVYFVRLSAGAFTSTKKMILVK